MSIVRRDRKSRCVNRESRASVRGSVAERPAQNSPMMTDDSVCPVTASVNASTPVTVAPRIRTPFSGIPFGGCAGTVIVVVMSPVIFTVAAAATL